MKKRILIFCILSLLFIGCDQTTKGLAKEHLMNKPTLSYFNDTVRLLYVENTGAFLSFGADWPKAISFIVLTIFPILFLFGFSYVVLRKSQQYDRLQLAGITLIFSGGMGNLIDRVLYDRHVTDFINLGIENIRTGIFNVADMYITGGAILLLIHAIKNHLKKPAEAAESSDA